MNHETLETQEGRKAASTSSTEEGSGTLRPAGERLDKVCRSYRRNQRGASAVEFAVVAPVFFLLIFGMIEYGRMVMVQQVITNASREGCRRAVIDGSTYNDVQAAVNNYLTSAGIKNTTLTVNPNPPNTATAGSPVTVTVSVPFSQVSWLPSPMFLGGTQLRATTVMRRETVQ
jgi:Flp pilus assembly protein TadG